MQTLTPEQEKMLKETYEAVRSVQQLLKGYNGTEGLVTEFKKLKLAFYTFRLGVIVSFTLLIGGSGFGLAKVLELLR